MYISLYMSINSAIHLRWCRNFLYLNCKTAKPSGSSTHIAHQHLLLVSANMQSLFLCYITIDIWYMLYIYISYIYIIYSYSKIHPGLFIYTIRVLAKASTSEIPWKRLQVALRHLDPGHPPFQKSAPGARGKSHSWLGGQTENPVVEESFHWWIHGNMNHSMHPVPCFIKSSVQVWRYESTVGPQSMAKIFSFKLQLAIQ